MNNVDKLIQKIRMYRTKPNDQVWIEQATAWRIAQEKGITKNTSTKFEVLTLARKT